ncbi:hypothetical protein [Pseudomonas nitroreducens]|uniref:hypothetical protein n=1 Tax=Pseudomonas nitroreducens TaxID=46680 RepID=UPI0038204CEE
MPASCFVIHAQIRHRHTVAQVLHHHPTNLLITAQAVPDALGIDRQHRPAIAGELAAGAGQQGALGVLVEVVANQFATQGLPQR